MGQRGAEDFIDGVNILGCIKLTSMKDHSYSRIVLGLSPRGRLSSLFVTFFSHMSCAFVDIPLYF